jgi:hypothetical protein
MTQLTPAMGQAMWMVQSGSSASSLMRNQAVSVNSQP